VYERVIFDTPGFDTKFAEVLESEAVCAAAVQQFVGRLHLPGGINQINEIFSVEGAFEIVVIVAIVRILLEIAVGDRHAPIGRDIHADLVCEFLLPKLGDARALAVFHRSLSRCQAFQLFFGRLKMSTSDLRFYLPRNPVAST
jgi:hypothetical protein